MTVVDVTHMPFITLHALQAFPPSLLNRDDNHAAKQIVYGGTVRVRVSSGAGKRAIRVAMRDAAITGGQYGLRTTRFPTLTTELLVTQYGRPLPEAAAKTAMVFAELKLKANKSGNTAAPIFASPRFPAATAAAIDSDWDRIGAAVPPAITSAARAALDVHDTVDLALFGRMLAEIPGKRVDGAAGVSHSFSVDPASIEPDFWSTVDDAALDGDAASSNLGESFVTAPVLYRSAFLDRRQLRTNLSAAADPEQLAVAAERSFIEWFVRAVPVAKQRSSVAATLPSLVIATCGSQVLSGAAAFTSPINGSEILKSAAASLLATLGRSDEVIENQTHVMLSTDPGLDAVINGAHHTNLRDFIDSVGVR
ncbi:type I-E CRISPR-associated protein Cas7/Cse4/CasC [Mycobacterium hodleri]|uniref:type I-E CRISPR-associated protein Cas7/Cse4/CasC n=1 Tax=Mycolicibacterium hodleri TaxID=49897 RepID=UPI0021F33B53|nr:type I-E CRISPR-associated protein Cas7/Cse4/CasC [Mycolicibacterium hodleri]MCV7133200.1 type I-E CRISPR-associated protein Cas7/Cse4/CasC [Mycolicibacterium hodleri]